MIAVCRPANPPEAISTSVEATRIIPQITFTLLGGFNFPPVVCMPSTKVAESADVTKNVVIKHTVSTDKMIPNGSCWNT